MVHTHNIGLVPTDRDCSHPGFINELSSANLGKRVNAEDDASGGLTHLPLSKHECRVDLSLITR